MKKNKAEKRIDINMKSCLRFPKPEIEAALFDQEFGNKRPN